MFEHVLQRQTLLRIGHKDPRDEVFRLGTHTLLVDLVRLQIEVLDVAISIVFCLSGERCRTSEEFKAENADRPNIDLIVVWLLIDELRGHVVHGATESCASLVNRVR